MPKTAWVTGAGGLIGSHIVQAASTHAPDWQVRALTRSQFDLCDSSAVEKSFCADAPELIIHCAAISKSPECEANPELAWAVNFGVTERLARLAADARFVFLSTDLVFDGQKGHYDEAATVSPLNVYGRTKVAAEKVVLANPGHTVIRTSLNGGPSPTGDRGFDEQLLLAWKNNRKTRLFKDEFRSPIAAAVTARALWEIVQAGLCGLYHVAGAERLSRWEIGCLIASRWPQFADRIEPGSLKDYQGPPRAPDTSLDCRKVQAALSFELPGFRGGYRGGGTGLSE